MLEGGRDRTTKNIVNKEQYNLTTVQDRLDKAAAMEVKEKEPESMLKGTRDRSTKNIINREEDISRPKKKQYHNFGYRDKSAYVPKMKKLGYHNINIETWADIDSQTWYCWGDHWVKEKLQQAFEELGANVGVEPKDADFTVYLWGSPYKQRVTWPYFYNPLPNNTNICWHYSHPTKMTPEEIRKYHIIFCLSKYHIPTIKPWHPNVMTEPLISCTDFKVPEVNDTPPIDVLFVGNARGGLQYGRKAVYWLDPPEGTKVQVYGHKWHSPNYHWMSQWYAGQYWKYEDLNLIYNKAKITLVDGHEDMADLGFVPMKIFDVLASGGFVLAAANKGIKEIFGNWVPQFENKREMNNLINHFLTHETERQEFSDRGRKIAERETFKSRAQTFIKTFDEYKSIVKKNR